MPKIKGSTSTIPPLIFVKMSKNSPPITTLLSEAEATANAHVRSAGWSMSALGIAPPPLPIGPDLAWREQLLNGHLRYTVRGSWDVRDDVLVLRAQNPARFPFSSVVIPHTCESKPFISGFNILTSNFV